MAVQCNRQLAVAGRPACISGSAGGDAVTLQVHETTGMASVMMTYSSAAGTLYSRHPAAADLQPRPQFSSYITTCSEDPAKHNLSI